MRTLLQVLEPMSLRERDEFAKRVGRGYAAAYLWMVATGHRRASPSLARALVEADPRLRLDQLRPDVWGRR